MLPALASEGWHCKVPGTGWLTPQKAGLSLVLEDRRLRRRCQQGGLCGRICPWSLSVSGDGWQLPRAPMHVDASLRCICRSSLCFRLPACICACVMFVCMRACSCSTMEEHKMLIVCVCVPRIFRELKPSKAYLYM